MGLVWSAAETLNVVWGVASDQGYSSLQERISEISFRRGIRKRLEESLATAEFHHPVAAELLLEDDAFIDLVCDLAPDERVVEFLEAGQFSQHDVDILAGILPQIVLAETLTNASVAERHLMLAASELRDLVAELGQEVHSLSARVTGNASIVVSGASGSATEIRVNETSSTLPLRPPFVPTEPSSLSPAMRVSARVKGAPFLGRHSVLAEIDEWLDSDESFSTFLVGGFGGSGKTRLAAEVADLRMNRDAWITGFYTGGRNDDTALEALASLPTARLIIVDYAETRSREIELLLNVLQQRSSPEHPVRILFLVRSPADDTSNGWSSAVRGGLTSPDTLSLLIDMPIRVLRPEDDDAPDPEALAIAVARAFGNDPNLEATIKIAKDSSPLESTIAGYLAAKTPDHAVEASVPAELFEQLTLHERNYWIASIANIDGLDVPNYLLIPLITFGSLCGATSKAEGRSLLAASGILDETGVPLASANELLALLYPGERWWNQVHPDRYAEHLLVKADLSVTAIDAALARSDASSLRQPLNLLARSFGGSGEEYQELRHKLSTKFPELLSQSIAYQPDGMPIVEMARRNPSEALAAIIPLALTDLAQASSLASSLPRSPFTSSLSVAINERRVELARQAVQRHRATANIAELSEALNELGIMHRNYGSVERGLVVGEEALELRRQLAHEDKSFLPDLAASLNDVGVKLADAERSRQLTAESVRIRRALLTSDVSTQAALAESLGNLAYAKHRQDNARGAIGHAEESVNLYQSIFLETSLYAEQYAGGLNNLGVMYGALGNLSAARDASMNALHIRKQLAAQDPAQLLYYVQSLNNVGVRLVKLGLRDEARTLFTDAVGVGRELTEASSSFRETLGNAVHNLGYEELLASEYNEAIEHLTEAVRVRSELAREHSIHREDLDMSELRLAEARAARDG